MARDKALIVQCSLIKSELKRGPAKDIYRGQVMILGLQFADKFDLEPFILSGKYGIITPNTIVDNYDHFCPRYNGHWPEYDGWWLGGKNYFKNAPVRFQPLIPNNRGYGDMKHWLKEHINGKS